jgi:hypothetical protein
VSAVESTRRARLQSANKNIEKNIAAIDMANKPESNAFENLNLETNSMDIMDSQELADSDEHNEYFDDSESNVEFNNEPEDSLDDEKWDTDIEEEKGSLIYFLHSLIIVNFFEQNI